MMNARKLIVELLDDPNGINDVAYTCLYDFAVETGNEDVIKQADCQDSRWFLPEHCADELRKTLDNTL